MTDPSAPPDGAPDGARPDPTDDPAAAERAARDDRAVRADRARQAEEIRARRADRARQALVAPWSRQRARRVGLVAVVLGVLGPLLGTATALLLIPSQPGDVLDLDQERAGVIDARGTVRTIDTVRGEVGFQLTLARSDAIDAASEAADVFTEDGRLAEELTLVVNDANGESTRVLAAGGPPGGVSATVELTDSRATRYPVDRYRATMLLAVRRADGDPVPVRLSLRSSDPGFSVDVTEDASQPERALVQMSVTRRGTVIGWAAFFVIVCWMLAIAAASIGWTTVVHGIAAPAWAWGFLVGILFALPPLRNALPGTPPSGSLVDLAAFYWAVGIVALTLVAMIGSWNLRVRRAPSEPDSPTPRA